MPEPLSSEGFNNDNSNAPRIPYASYIGEKSTFAGSLIGAILYGITIVLFFRCMSALLSRANRKTGAIRLGLIAHTVAMFSFVTIYVTVDFHILSISHIDNRAFPGGDGLPPGPVGYRLFLYSKPIGMIIQVMFLLNNWLANGLLLYRCYVIYTMDYLVIALPCLIYLTSIATGIVFTAKVAPRNGVWVHSTVHTGVPYLSISVSLNVLLTLMIVVRLALHYRKIRSAIGAQEGVGGMYKTIAMIIVESSTLFVVTSLLFIGPWAVQSWLSGVFSQVLAETQVISPFLIILRVADQIAVTSDTIGHGSISSVRFRNRSELTGGVRTYPSENPVGSVG